ncbi:rio2 [Cordylochernes scorpioides]|uniref:non-specific serine/threonine protein kinase n=1 Tax=Cordylochernes scorpioides TaxID=51811 RepID=A0ABY6KUH9_9ARAC|nr:rio2 [Cordylochernes scorpioides]
MIIAVLSFRENLLLLFILEAVFLRLVGLRRLGRISFRKVKEKRDYLRRRSASSWLYLSRLSALKEYAFLKVLEENGFPVPHAHGHNRHCVVMSLVKGTQLQQVYELENVELLYQRLMKLIARLAEHGLIHCDFNEFNIMVCTKDEAPVIIDFPQMVSTTHYNAQTYFERDVDCIRSFFSKRFNYVSEDYPTFDEVVSSGVSLDIKSKASGYIPNKKELRDAFESRFIIGGKKLEGEESSSEDEPEEEESSEEEEEDEIDESEENLQKIDLRMPTSEINEQLEELEENLSSTLNLDPSAEGSEDNEEENKTDGDSGHSSEEEDTNERKAPSGISNHSHKSIQERIKRQHKQKKQAARRAKLKGESGQKRRRNRDAIKDLQSF